MLANRLSEDPKLKVALVEAGGWDRNPWIRIPLAWPRILLKRMNDWMYFSEPEAALDNRRIECAASSNPSHLAIIRQYFLTRDKDWRVLRDGLRRAQQIGRQRPLTDFVAAQTAPIHDSNEALDAHIRATAITVDHPACTCRMGPHPIRIAWSTRSFASSAPEIYVSSTRPSCSTSSAATSTRQ